jgi:UDP-3-O-[3-hydroxymyristoyl] glucosamine N-acyltransferase
MQDGFGFVVDKEVGSANHVKKPQELRATIGDDVEIGANTTIDRGSWRNTAIHSGCKLDNLIQIGHNVVLGKGCLMAAQSGIAGSTTVGEKVMIGGQVGIAQHLSIGDNVRIAAKSGVMNDLARNCTYGGYPATEILNFHRQTLFLRNQSGKETPTDLKDTCFNIVYVTVPTEQVGKDIGEKLVRERLAACVNIVPGLQSIYKWEERLEVDKELLLVIKSRKELFQLVQWSVEEAHPYDSPEVVSFSLDTISDRYRQWLEESLLSIS